jgi:hypothetical protein
MWQLSEFLWSRAQPRLRRIVESPKPDRQMYLTKVSEVAAKYEELVQRATTQR